MSGGASKRIFVVSLLLGLAFTGFSWRLIYLQVGRHEYYLAKAEEKHVARKPIHARRGMIQDVNGEVLAQDEPMKVVVADGSLLENHEAVAEVLSSELAMDRGSVLAKLKTRRVSKEKGVEADPSRYIVIHRKVPEDVAGRIEARLSQGRLRGVRFEPDSDRVYPNGQLLCHVVGYVNGEGKGVEGIERNFEMFLKGQDGFRFIERDRRGAELMMFRRQERPAHNGANVRLTVDLGFQQIVERELEEACKYYKPKMAVAVFMRPQTGEVLAMANRPGFDPGDIEKSPMDARRNRAITDMVEPGSTFKIVTTAAALQQKLVNIDTTIFCENGHFLYAGTMLKDHHNYGDLSVGDILVKSSNIGVAKLGLQLGDHRLYEYIRRFGFGERTGINLPGEIAATVHPPHRWTKISVTHVPMGHEVTATPLQVVAAMAAVANGGKLMMPQIVREVTDSEGNVVRGFEPTEVRQAITPQVSATVRGALVDVVKRGTAKAAAVKGFTVAGKTGTAQKLGANGTYEHKYVVSFVGFMPAEDPQFVGLVMIDDAQGIPSNTNTGGGVCAPIFSKIADKAARYLNLTPSSESSGSGPSMAHSEPIRK